MVRTYLDTCVLIELWRGSRSEDVMSFLESQERRFVYSFFLKLELLPKAIYYQQEREIEFYQAFLQEAEYCDIPFDRIQEKAYRLACEFGLSGIDAIHLAYALESRCDELITLERRRGGSLGNVSLSEIEILVIP